MNKDETLRKAYGSIPKEVGINVDFFDWVPTFRGIKYYWYKLVRKVTRWADRVAEGTPLLREHTGKNLYREFESLAHRQILKKVKHVIY